MFTKLAIAALATATAALPAPQSSTTIGVTPPKHKEFALAMDINGTMVSLNAVTNGTLGNLVLEAQRLSAYPGTPAYLNGTSPNAALNFDLTDSTDPYNQGIFGAYAPAVGDNYGYSTDVTAIFGFQQFEWGVTDGQLFHKLDAAFDAFFACKDTVNGVENYVLKWGVYQSNASPPVGCLSTKVVQDLNVPGGLRKPKPSPSPYSQ